MDQQAYDHPQVSVVVSLCVCVVVDDAVCYQALWISKRYGSASI